MKKLVLARNRLNESKAFRFVSLTALQFLAFSIIYAEICYSRSAAPLSLASIASFLVPAAAIIALLILWIETRAAIRITRIYGFAIVAIIVLLGVSALVFHPGHLELIRRWVYRLVLQDESGREGYAPIYHCPFCGGVVDAVDRLTYPERISREETHRLLKLTAGLKTLSDVREKLGPPDYESPLGTITRPVRRGREVSQVEVIRTLRYQNLSDVAAVVVFERSDGSLGFEFESKQTPNVEARWALAMMCVTVNYETNFLDK
jgi:hypothetical protein